MGDIDTQVLAGGKVLEGTGDVTRAEQVALSGDIASRIVDVLERISTSLDRLLLIASAATGDEDLTEEGPPE